MPRLHFAATSLSLNFSHNPFVAGSGNTILSSIASAGHTPATFGMLLPVFTRDFVINRFWLTQSLASILTGAAVNDLEADRATIVLKPNGEKELFYDSPIVIPAGWTFRLYRIGGGLAGEAYGGWIDWEQWIL